MPLLSTTLAPRGPYELRLVAGGGSDRTRSFRDGVLTCVLRAGASPAHARVWQRRDGRIELLVEGEAPDAAVELLRFVLALDDDHTEFLRRFSRDALIGDTTRRLQGLRPLRTATVAHALLRALCGQLITAREARLIEARIVRRTCVEHAGLHLPPERADLARFSPAELCRSGLASRRASALVRIARAWDVEKLRGVETRIAVRRVCEERMLGPWSAGVVCLEGLGRREHGLVGDLGLIKLCTARLGREATPEDTAELLARYGEWQGLASVYLLASGHVGPADLEVRRQRWGRRRQAWSRAA